MKIIVPIYIIAFAFMLPFGPGDLTAWMIALGILGLIIWAICRKMTHVANMTMQGAGSVRSILLVTGFFAFWGFIVWLL